MDLNFNTYKDPFGAKTPFRKVNQLIRYDLKISLYNPAKLMLALLSLPLAVSLM